jgi:serine/threonine protein kinase
MSINSSLDNFKIIKTLGKGCSGKVKLGLNTHDNQLYALKIAYGGPSRQISSLKSLSREKLVSDFLEHEGVNRVLQVCPEGIYVSKRGKADRVCCYAVTKYIARGDFFDFVTKAHHVDENTARHFFTQMVDLIDYLHSKNIGHRDVKAENFMLDSELNIKLIDLGFATTIDPSKPNTTRLGTEPYMAPEVQYELPYNPAKSDIFSLGVILFMMLHGHLPFSEATENDPHYKLFVANPKGFWAYHAKVKAKIEVSDSAKQLLTSMFCINPHSRISMDQIKRSRWMHQSVDSAKAIRNASVVFLNSI